MFNELNSNWLKFNQIDLNLIDFICNQFWNFYFFISFEKIKYNFNNVNIWKNNTWKWLAYRHILKTKFLGKT